MGIKDRLKDFRIEETENFSQVAANKTKDIIKTIGGYGIKRSSIMPDNIVLVTGSSGGTGVSTIVSNLAYILSSMLKDTLDILIIDLNILCPMHQIFFGSSDWDKLPGDKDLVAYLFGQASIGEATRTNGNVSVMYAENRTIADLINCEEKIAIENLRALIDKSRDLYDVVLIDCPMRVDSALCNTAMFLADSMYCVWDEGLGSIVNTDRLRRQLGFTGIDSYSKMYVIMNKKTSVKYSSFPFEKLDIELIETLPFSTDVIYSNIDGDVYCRGGKARNKNGAYFERAMVALADKILMIGGRTEYKGESSNKNINTDETSVNNDKTDIE